MDAPIDVPRPRPPENPVREVTVPKNSVRRGFTYYEQPFTETAVSDSWMKMIFQLEQSRSQKYPPIISGVLTNGLLRWTIDGPNHSFLVQPEATRIPRPRVPMIAIDVSDKLSISIKVFGVNRDELFRIASYLKSNIHGRNQAPLAITEYSVDDWLTSTKVYNGTLGDFNANTL